MRRAIQSAARDLARRPAGNLLRQGATASPEGSDGMKRIDSIKVPLDDQALLGEIHRGRFGATVHMVEPYRCRIGSSVALDATGQPTPEGLARARDHLVAVYLAGRIVDRERAALERERERLRNELADEQRTRAPLDRESFDRLARMLEAQRRNGMAAETYRGKKRALLARLRATSHAEQQVPARLLQFIERHAGFSMCVLDLLGVS